MPVGFDAAAFQNQVHRFARGGAERSQFVQPGGNLIVEIAGELAAPAVEAEVQQHRLTGAINRDRSVIARPDIVGGRHVQQATIPPGAGGGQQVENVLAMLVVMASDNDFLVTANGGGQRGKGGIDLIQPGSPIAVGVRPGQQDGVMRRPFGG